MALNSSSVPPLYTVVTAVRNGSKVIRQTLESVLSQREIEFELIVIDGGSTDGTLEIVSECSDKIALVISEPDRGVYDAMNKGIRHATGAWINFMNAGDTFDSDTTLSQVAPDLRSGCAVVYGRHRQSGRVYCPRAISQARYAGPLACHQAMFFNRLLVNELLYYDLSYRIFADWDLTLRVLEQFGADRMCSLPITVCDYAAGGMSSGFQLSKVEERLRLLYSRGGITRVVQGCAQKIVDECKKMTNRKTLKNIAGAK